MKTKGPIINRNYFMPGNLIASIIVWFSALLSLFPIYWMITGSFKAQTASVKIPPELIPIDPSILNYINIVNKAPIERWFLNSVIISLASTFMVCLVSSLAGYAFAKKNFLGKNFLFWMIIGSMMIPRQLLLIPLFRLMIQFGLVNTLISAVLPIIAWPFGVFLMRQFTQTLPTEILEAAKIDGCSEIRLFTNIVFPMIKPGLGALAIFTFAEAWNDYLWQLVILSETNKFTMIVGIASLKSKYFGEYGLQMAGSLIAAAPMLIIFILFQRYFIKGITLGSVKG